jgi:Rieske Fe-S protein
MAIDRRRFIELSAGILAGTTLASCAAATAVRVTPTAGEIRLGLAEFPQLGRAGGFLKLQPDGSPTPIYVLALDGGEFAALSPICTHLGCTVDVSGELLICPCHGSTYDQTGQVLRGPAERPLQRYPASVTSDSQLVIRMEGTA